ncbi:type I-E CRISPR-associated protein Cse2/CasB [Spirochaeta cellobiosiphila]|uniref:type I-E CRISPR-associated protein Cse2/CasB n=1 Tax=Spirochaeta cellobiosiphila TaxID=504483 RepID=UPI00048CD105|nr:type I-E CRISPR-associated protein Cse2/CasB [Spirochaeta cellobiosiphila]
MDDKQSSTFVKLVMERCHGSQDKGYRAKLRKGENPNTEYYCWDILSSYVNLEYPDDRRVYALIGADIANRDVTVDGEYGLGEALAMAYQDHEHSKDDTGPGGARLRRLLACQNRKDLLLVLPSLLHLLRSKGITINHSRLLEEVFWFDREDSRERTRSLWAKQFYHDWRGES